MQIDKWRIRYLQLARHVSLWSKDPRKKVGAVITEGHRIRGVGYNGFPTGIEDTPYRLADKELKNLLMVHAEVNCLISADGIGDTIYIYPCLPCTQCLGNIIQNGRIKTIVTLPIDTESSWNQEFVVELIEDAGLTVVFIEPELLDLT